MRGLAADVQVSFAPGPAFATATHGAHDWESLSLLPEHVEPDG